MPSKSPAQARLMAGVAHDPKFAKKVGVPQSVGEEFNEADKGTGILKGKRKSEKPKPSRHAKLDEALHKATNAAGWGGIAGEEPSGSGIGGV